MAENAELIGVAYHPGRVGTDRSFFALQMRSEKRFKARAVCQVILHFIRSCACVRLMSAIRACDDANEQSRSIHSRRFVAIALENPPDEASMLWVFPFRILGQRKSKNLFTRLRLQGNKTKQWHYLVRKCEQFFLGFDYHDFHGLQNILTFADALELSMALEELNHKQREVRTRCESNGVLLGEIHNYIFQFINPHHRVQEEKCKPSSGQGAHESFCTRPVLQVGSDVIRNFDGSRQPQPCLDQFFLRRIVEQAFQHDDANHSSEWHRFDPRNLRSARDIHQLRIPAYARIAAAGGPRGAFQGREKRKCR